MPDTSTILSLPLILPAQAQKHVTHNEALRLLDIVVQLAVKDRGLTAAPVAVPGDRYIVAAGATGVWAGQAGKIALYEDAAWQFISPLAGWRAWVADEAAVATFDGTVWATLAEAALSVGQLGVSAVADAANRLSVSSPATLLNHAGAGHQLKLNKAASTDTASLLFQTGFSGRAEMGTMGADDFGIKTSANGTAFLDALTVARASGVVSLPQGIAAGGFSLRDDADPSKRAYFSTAGLTPATSRTYSLPDISSELAALGGTQTFTGNKTVSGSFTVTAAAVAIGTATTTATYGFATGATAAASTKTVALGTGGAAGSNTSVTIGSSVAGALGSTVFNSPAVDFAASVTAITAAEAAVSAKYLGLGGASGDATNRLSINSPAVLLNHSGAGHQLKVNKAAATDTASLTFQTGFSGRAEMGTTGSDDFAIKVSPDGSSFFTAMTVARADGQITLPAALRLGGQAGDPVSPANGAIWLNTTTNEVKVRSNGTTVVVATASGGGLADGDKGDVSVTASGSVWTIDAGVISNAKLASVATATLKGRAAAGSGAPEDLTAAQATALLATVTTSTKGLAPASGGGTANFLRADGTWAAPAGGGGIPDGDKGDVIVAGAGAVWTLDPAVKFGTTLALQNNIFFN